MVKTEKAWIFDEVIKGKQKVKKPTDSKLKIITRIGEKVVEKKKVIAKIEAEVKLAREQLRKSPLIIAGFFITIQLHW